jgi:hypothetical protein
MVFDEKGSYSPERQTLKVSSNMKSVRTSKSRETPFFVSLKKV